jgi:hypothetical protein
MGITFSLRSALIAVAYTALAAATIFQPTWGCAYLLWVVVFLSLMVAVVVLCFGRGPIQAKALGCILLSCLLIFLIRYFPAVSPSRQALYYAGAPVSQGISSFSPWQSLMQVTDRRFRSNSKVNSHIAQMEQMIVDASRAVAADAISVQLAGLIGVVVGGVTFRRLPAKRTVETQ